MSQTTWPFPGGVNCKVGVGLVVCSSSERFTGLSRVNPPLNLGTQMAGVPVSAGTPAGVGPRASLWGLPALNSCSVKHP